MRERFRAGDPPDGSFTEVARWHLHRLGDLHVLRTALRSSVPVQPVDLQGGLEVGQPDQASETVSDRLLLVANELASNALRHSDGDAVVVLAHGVEGWLVDVSDVAVDAEPTPAMDRSPGDGGYGLYLVAELATAVGWYDDARRKHVWGQVTADRSA